MKVAILHAYSAHNVGDGMLVTEAIDLLESTFPSDNLEITLFASDPTSFASLGVSVLPSKPTLRGYDRRYLHALRALDKYDLVVGVGGGYLRGGNCVELAKALLVHGVQLRQASKVGSVAVYLPQSIGPLRLASAPWFRGHLRKLSRVWARDDRTVAELSLPSSVRRVPDMAVLQVERRETHHVNEIPVYSVRNLRGGLPEPLVELARLLGIFDGYVQSQTGGNHDLAPMESLEPRKILSRDEILQSPEERRVVVAVRLHAALMALQAGHYVVHLSYERKGFAAFKDLGLEKYVHNAFSFDPAEVKRQVEFLVQDERSRNDYDQLINSRVDGVGDFVSMLQDSLRAAARARPA